MRFIEVLLLAGLFVTAVGCFYLALISYLFSHDGMEEYNNMAKKDTKLEEIRVRIPKEYKSILDEYCDTFGTTIQAHVCRNLRPYCGGFVERLARTREVVVKLNNFTLTLVRIRKIRKNRFQRKLDLILRKKEQSKYPKTLTHHGRYPRRMDSTTRERWPRSWIGRLVEERFTLIG